MKYMSVETASSSVSHAHPDHTQTMFTKRTAHPPAPGR